jgi:hypothetical protein
VAHGDEVAQLGGCGGLAGGCGGLVGYGKWGSPDCQRSGQEI